MIQIESDPLTIYLIIKVWAYIYGPVPIFVQNMMVNFVRICDCWSDKIYGVKQSSSYCIRKYNEAFGAIFNTIYLNGFNITNTICLTSKCLINTTYKKYAVTYQYLLYINQGDGECNLTQNMILALTSTSDSYSSIWWNIYKARIYKNDDNFEARHFPVQCKQSVMYEMMKQKCVLQIDISTITKTISIHIIDKYGYKLYVGKIPINSQGKYYIQLLTKYGFATYSDIEFTTVLFCKKIIFTLNQ